MEMGHMGGTGNSSTGIKVLKAVAIVAVVVTVAALGFVIVHQSTKGSGGGTSVGMTGQPEATVAGQEGGPSTSAGSSRTASAGGSSQGASRPAGLVSTTTGGSGERSSLTTSLQPSGRPSTGGSSSTGSVGTGRLPSDSTSGTAGSRRNDGESGNASERPDVVAEAPESGPLVADKSIVFIPHQWDPTSGELIVGDRRYLTRLAQMQRSNLDRQTHSTVGSLRETMRNRVEFQIKEINQELREAVETYHKAIAEGDSQTANDFHHAIKFHLVDDRQRILDTVDRQLDELILEALP
jgi:hypothetical protein